MFFQNSSTCRLALAISFATSLLIFPIPSRAQKAGVDETIRAQNQSINQAVKQGTMTNKQAARLRSNLANISAEIKQARQANGGKLKPVKLTQIQNELNGTGNVIQSSASAGKKSRVSSAALGPKWNRGADGAQNAKKLTQGMKQEERRELRQERQAQQQVKEGQQQEYEKQMLQVLGKQRPEILNNKHQIEKVREQTGAN